jgi:hypothetical protein
MAMFRFLIGAALAAMMAGPAAAEGAFSEGSQAEGFGSGLQGAEPALFKAKVVDVLCELTGECAEQCGAGLRPIGLVREADGVLVLTAKNDQTSFNGATHDLAPYCGQTVTVDGFLIGDPDVAPTKVYMVKLIRPEGASEWTKAKGWTAAWNARNPEAKGKGPWFRRDPAVAAEIERRGWLGLGAEADKTFIEEFY